MLCFVGMVVGGVLNGANDNASEVGSVQSTYHTKYAPYFQWPFVAMHPSDASVGWFFYI